MTDTNAAALSLANAAQSLRDTAKWLVGGVAATAAGVFAGSSLTSLGSLDVHTDSSRLIVAGVGCFAGFVGLAFIVAAAIRVLNRKSVTFREFVASTVSEEVKIREKLLLRYRGDLAGSDTFAGYVQLVDDAYRANPRNQAQTDLINRAGDLTPIITADAGFHLVKNRYNCLIIALAVGTVICIGGFGTFAWAANPPKHETPAAPSISIPGLHCGN